MTEQRKFTRVLFETKAVVQADSISLEGEIKNLSLNGMFMSVPSSGDVVVGTDVVASIMIEGKGSLTTIRTRGTVVRLQGDGLAIQFDSDATELDSFVLLKAVLLSNGGDQQTIENEFQQIQAAK
jgi:hypothetical protein